MEKKEIKIDPTIEVLLIKMLPVFFTSKKFLSKYETIDDFDGEKKPAICVERIQKFANEDEVYIVTLNKKLLQKHMLELCKENLKGEI